MSKKPGRPHYRPSMKSRSTARNRLSQKATRLRRYATSVNTVVSDPEMGAMTRSERFMRTALDLWMVTIEEQTKDGWFEPELSADGTPVENQFGQRRETRPPEDRVWGLRAGSAWMTKELLRTAWLTEFNQSFYHVDYPEHYDLNAYKLTERDRKAQERRLVEDGTVDRGKRPEAFFAMPSFMWGHPMDTHLTKWCKMGFFIRPPRRDGKPGFQPGQYFLSEKMCILLGREHVWDRHVDLDKKANANPGRHTSSQNAKWEDVFSETGRCTIWGAHHLLTVALANGAIANYDVPMAHAHISRRVEKGTVLKIAPGIYHTVEAHPEGRTVKPEMDDWFTRLLWDAGHRIYTDGSLHSTDTIAQFMEEDGVTFTGGMKRFRKFATPYVPRVEALFQADDHPTEKGKFWRLADRLTSYFEIPIEELE